MPYVPFYSKFPETAVTETRSINVYQHPDLPIGEYGFIELFCDEPGCDCRRVMFNVFAPQSPDPLAVIAFGWESKEFYAKWLGRNDHEAILEMQGPCFNRMSKQSPFAPILLEMAVDLLSDEAYVDRIKRHYTMFRREIEKGSKPKRRSRPRKPKRKR